MLYSNLIDVKLSTAYKQLKDLAEDVVFISNTVEPFDFAAGEPAITSAPERTIQAVVLKEGKDKGVKYRQLLFKTVDLPTVTGFDQVKIGGEPWSVGYMVHQRRYVTLLDIYRGD